MTGHDYAAILRDAAEIIEDAQRAKQHLESIITVIADNDDFTATYQGDILDALRLVLQRLEDVGTVSTPA
jgi:hypothetical protein